MAVLSGYIIRGGEEYAHIPLPCLKLDIVPLNISPLTVDLDTGYNGRYLLVRCSHGLRIEPYHPRQPSEYHISSAHVAVGISRETVSGEAVRHGEYPAFARICIKPAKAVVGAYPEMSVRILLNSAHHLVGESVFYGIFSGRSTVVAEQAFIGAYPQAP